MKKEKACWICRRTEEELLKDLKEFMDLDGFPDDIKKRKKHILISSDIGSQKSYICQGCSFHIFNSVLRDRDEGIVPEYTIATLGDIHDLKEKIVNVFKEE